MEDLETSIDSLQLTVRDWKTEFEAFKYDIQNQQELYHDIFKRHIYNEINEKINEINQIFHQTQDQYRDDIESVKKQKEKEYKRRIWLQGRKRRK